MNRRSFIEFLFAAPVAVVSAAATSPQPPEVLGRHRLGMTFYKPLCLGEIEVPHRYPFEEFECVAGEPIFLMCINHPALSEPIKLHHVERAEL